MNIQGCVWLLRNRATLRLFPKKKKLIISRVETRIPLPLARIILNPIYHYDVYSRIPIPIPIVLFQLFYCNPKQLQLCSIITYQKNQVTTGNLKGMLIPLTRALYQ